MQSYIFLILIGTKARVTKKRHLSTVGNRGLALLSEILLLEFYPRKREKRECIYLKDIMGKAITFDQAELNFNLCFTSE